MTDKQKKRIAQSGHSLPLTRRQFMGLGLIQGPGVLLAPTLFGLLRPGIAEGAECISGSGVSGSMIPALIIDCRGGIGLSRIFPPGMQNEDNRDPQLLSSYSLHAVGSGAITTVSPFGVPMLREDLAPRAVAADLVPDSTSFLRGLRIGLNNGVLPADASATGDPSAWGKITMAILCNKSQDDSSGNKLNPAIYMAKSGLVGDYFPAMGTNAQGNVAGNSQSPIDIPELRPLVVQSVNDATNSISIGASLRALSDGQKNGLLRTIQKLKASQMQKLNQMTLAEQLSSLSGCSIQKAIDQLSQGSAVVDPRQDPFSFSSQAYSDFTPTNDTSNIVRDRNLLRDATVAYNVIKGNSGPGTIVVDGCDYHGSSRIQERVRDQEVGQTLGRAIRLAELHNKKLFFAMITDGGVSSDPGAVEFRSDSGVHGLAVMGIFDPAGRHDPVNANSYQLGSYNNAQAVENTRYIGDIEARVAQAMLLNYLVLNGQKPKFSQLVSSSEFASLEVDRHIIFKG